MGAGAPRHEPGEKPTTVPRVRARRLVLARALLVLASTAVVLAGLEWYLRFRISAYWNMIEAPADASRRYDLRPRAWARYRGVIMTCDPLGMRTTIHPETSQEVAPRQRVLFLGDSFMFGLGSTDAFTIPSRFAAFCADGGEPIRALNGGVFGYDLRDQHGSLERWRALRPRTVIWGLYENDLQASTYVRLEPQRATTLDRLWESSMLLRIVQEKAGLLRDLLGRPSPPDSREAPAASDPSSLAAQSITGEHAREIFREVDRWARSESVEVYVAPIPAPFRLRDSAPPELHRQARTWTESSSVKYLDIWPALRGDHGYAWHAADMIHYNDTGSHHVSEAIYREWRRARPWSGRRTPRTRIPRRHDRRAEVSCAREQPGEVWLEGA